MRRILFVDDDPKILEDLRHMLRAQRDAWEMAFAPSGEAALALLGASPFDVIVAGLRGKYATVLLARVREQYPEVVRIVLSEKTELSAVLRSVAVAHQSLAKPCDAQTLNVAIERACHLKALLHDDAIRRTVGSLGDLPALPRTYESLAEALRDPDTPVRRIAAIVEQDVGISAKVLQLVNSAFFGAAKSVTNITNAVNLLGIDILQNLVLSFEVFRVFQPKVPVRGFSIDALQRHARLTALVVARLPLPTHLADLAVVASMLHDVGKLIMAWKLPERFARSLAEAEQEHCPLHTVEHREYGFGHAEIGGYLLGLWGLPYAVVEGVALHHRPERMTHRKFDVVAAVFVADRLAREIGGTPAPDPSEKPLDTFEGELTSMGIADDLVQWRADMAGIPALLAEA